MRYNEGDNTLKKSKELYLFCKGKFNKIVKILIFILSDPAC